MMDVENTILEAYLNRPVFTFKGEVPKGTARLRDQKWMTHVAACIHDWFGDRNSRHELLAQGADTRTAMRGAEVSVKEYIKWVEDGGGDDCGLVFSKSRYDETRKNPKRARARRADPGRATLARRRNGPKRARDQGVSGRGVNSFEKGGGV